MAEVVRSEVVVIGCGVAGLSAALHCGRRGVRLLCKGRFADSGSSPLAQGGVAVAVAPDDDPACHAKDTLAAAGGLGDPEVVRLVTAEGPRRLAELLAMGAAFDRDRGGGLALGREAAHSRRRVAHASGDATGSEIVRTLSRAVQRADHVRVHQGVTALDLLRQDGRVVGVGAVAGDGGRVLLLASAVVLATGGVGGLYSHTTNPGGNSGDGLAMAARAGARLRDLEFVQFHPTALADGSDPCALLTEALRGEGALLVDENGRRFMTSIHPDAELAPRDVVARAIWRRLQGGQAALLDARPVGPRLASRFPTVLDLCLRRGLDPRQVCVPVSPAAHYHMGGVLTDDRGRASVAGLWACGEVACTGLHGANRLASNSLLEALVMGARVGEDLAAGPLPVPSDRGAGPAPPVAPALSPASVARAVTRLREIMWRGVGVERHREGVLEALAGLDRLAPSLAGPEGRSMLTAARLIARAALHREESRGAHHRSDAPRPDPRWSFHLDFAGERLRLSGRARRVGAGW